MRKILIADDRELMRSALRSIFALRPDWEVWGEAADGHETIVKACDLNPDLIILDFQMPLADGLKAASEIQPDNAPHPDSYVHPLQDQ